MELFIHPVLFITKTAIKYVFPLKTFMFQAFFWSFPTFTNLEWVQSHQAKISGTVLQCI